MDLKKCTLIVNVCFVLNLAWNSSELKKTNDNSQLDLAKQKNI